MPDPTATGNMNIRQSLFTTATHHFEAGRLTTAESLIRQILNDDPQHAASLHFLGIIFHNSRRNLLAVKSIQAAISINPTAALFYSNLSLVQLEAGRLERALQQAERATRLAPSFAEAFNVLAAVQSQSGNFLLAENNCLRALQLNPDYIEGHYNLGTILQSQGKFEVAEAIYRWVSHKKPDFTGAYYNLGTILQSQGKFEEADAIYRWAIHKKPDFAGAYHNLGSVLFGLGLIDEAAQNMERAVKLEPRNAAFHYNLARAKRYYPDDPHLQKLEMLDQEIHALDSSNQVYLNFSLGKAYADLGKHEHSFRHILDGNAKKRSLIHYDEAAALAFFKRIEQTFTSELLRAKTVPHSPTDAPIFIVGMPRSGSTLIEQILASHRDVHGGGELNLFPLAMNKIFGASTFPEIIEKLSDDDLRLLGTTYLSDLKAIAPGKDRITDKLPENFPFCGLIHLAIPNARIIYTKRNPIDTCLSCFSTLFNGAQNYTYDLGELGRYYRQCDQLMNHWQTILPENTILEVQYEEVVENFENQLHRILDFCGLDWDDACRSFYETQRPVSTASATQVRKPLYKTSINRWQPPADILKPLTEALRIGTSSRS